MGKWCGDCRWCAALRGIWGLDCNYYRLYFDNSERAATCPHYEPDDEDDEGGAE